MPDKNVPPASWKKEFTWFCAALVISTILVGLSTKFRFSTIPIGQDPSFHFHPVKAVLYLAALLLTIKNIVGLFDITLKEVPPIAFIFSAIVPIIALLCIYLFYSRALIVHDSQAVEIARNQMWLLGILIAALSIIEIKIFLDIRNFLGRNYGSK